MFADYEKTQNARLDAFLFLLKDFDFFCDKGMGISRKANGDLEIQNGAQFIHLKKLVDAYPELIKHLLLFVLSLLFTFYLIIEGINQIDNGGNQSYYFIGACGSFLACCVFLSFLIVNVLKVCELEKINTALDKSKEQSSNTAEQLTLLADLNKRGVITQTEYDTEKQRILSKMQKEYYFANSYIFLSSIL